MISHQTRSILLYISAVLGLAMSVFFAGSSSVKAASEVSNAPFILKCVDEDKVYLLENIRQKVTRPAEKTIIEALLSEDAPKAVALYNKQLKDYPDPELDRISTSRIAAYNLVLNSSAPAPQVPGSVQVSSGNANVKTPVRMDTTTEKVANRTQTVDPPASNMRKENKTKNNGAFTLQFGSFGSAKNAETLAKKISFYEKAEIIQQSAVYKVRLSNTFTTSEEAADEARKLPFDAIVVPAR
jgi:cell division septation protein DedD